MTAREMIEAVQDFSEDDFDSSQMCIITVMSHGEDKRIFGTDGLFVQSEEMLKMFNNQAAPGLMGKPKLFIFAHCRYTKIGM